MFLNKSVMLPLLFTIVLSGCSGSDGFGLGNGNDGASDETTEMREHPREDCVSRLRIEDAFLRSAGLGSDLSRPWSLALDDEGIYYDGSRPSRLETLLRETVFTETLLQRATALVEACERHGVNLAVMLQHRRREASMALQQLLAQGRLGSVARAL